MSAQLSCSHQARPRAADSAAAHQQCVVRCTTTASVVPSSESSKQQHEDHQPSPSIGRSSSAPARKLVVQCRVLVLPQYRAPPPRPSPPPPRRGRRTGCSARCRSDEQVRAALTQEAAARTARRHCCAWCLGVVPGRRACCKAACVLLHQQYRARH